MLQNLAWDVTDAFTRAQFALFDSLCDQLRMTEDDRRFLLGLDEHDWIEWSCFVADGPHPGNPTAAEMLRRLAEASFTLAVLTERTC
jgi:hypothetical protein